MDVAQGQVGPEAKYDVAFEGGSLKAKLDYSGQLGGAGLYVSIGAKQVLEALKKAIPGVVDDAVISAIEAGLGL